MKCDKILELLPLYAENMLSKEEQGAVCEHLAACPSCQEELRFLKKITEEASNLPEIELSKGFDEALRNKLLAEKNKTAPAFYYKKHWKKMFAVVASVAVIALSVTALNTEFYKFNEEILRDKNNAESQKKEITENAEMEEALYSAEPLDVLKSPKEEKNALPETEKVKKDHEPQAAKENIADEEKMPDRGSTNASDLDYNYKAAEENDNAANENAVSMASMTAETESKNTETTGEKEQRSEEYNTEVSGAPKMSGGSGGGTARKVRTGPLYNKTVLNVTYPTDDDSILKLLEGYENIKGEYKIPLEEFYELADKIIAVPDAIAYYTNESFNEEYGTLKEKVYEGENSEVSDRILEIEEICKYGYIAVK